MKSTFKIGRISGIDLFVHWTFPVLLLGIFWFYVYNGLSILASMAGVALISTVFGCVLLHELGHAFMARRYRIPTLDIIMYPIGGVARLRSMPREPMQEFMIAIAGPAVNLAIAAILYVATSLMGGAPAMTEAFQPGAGILGILMWINLGLVVFNLLPAFPMDGGRVLRAALATQMDYRNATHTAGLIGQGLAFLFAVFGIINGVWSLPFVAMFVFMAARQEVRFVMENG